MAFSKSMLNNKMDRVHLLLLLLFVSAAVATWPNKRHALIQTVIKDPVTNLYFTSIDIGTNITVSVSFVIDLSQPYTWLDCFSGYSSSSYTPIDFDSPQMQSPQAHTPSQCTHTRLVCLLRRRRKSQTRMLRPSLWDKTVQPRG